MLQTADITHSIIFYALAVLRWLIPLGFLWFAWYVGKRMWIHYVRETYIMKIQWKLLQVQLPRDVYKSPLAMEIILTNAFHQYSGLGTTYERFWLGLVRIWFSLEIVSIEGKIYFFIRLPANLQRQVESQIYAQYPQAEIHEVPDYTNAVPAYNKNSDFDLWATEFTLSKPDPYPIKTYVDYGLDKTTGADEEQERVDPITAQLELMGAIGKGEQVWYQVVIRAQQSKFLYHFFGHHHDYEEEGAHLIEELKEKWSKTSKISAEGEEEEGRTALTKGQQATLFAIERNMSKIAFDVGIRCLYLAKKESYHTGTSKALGMMLKSYNSTTLNSFDGINRTNFADDPWQDITGSITENLKANMLFRYKTRTFFYTRIRESMQLPAFIAKLRPNFAPKTFVLSTEELATIFHFPGRVSETPTFRRLESRKAEPPQNLPM